MTKLKAEAIEILQDIPEERVATVIEILKGLRALCGQDEKPTVLKETVDSAMGVFSKYANPDLIPMEKEAHLLDEQRLSVQRLDTRGYLSYSDE